MLRLLLLWLLVLRFHLFALVVFRGLVIMWVRLRSAGLVRGRGLRKEMGRPRKILWQQILMIEELVPVEPTDAALL